jgi:glycosyltransferase involved in cell wall biosynthesis
MPAFHHERFIEQAIRSVLDQTYVPVELIVVDDCSTDRTAEIAEGLARDHGFTFVRNEENSGLNPTIERALSLSSGVYVSVLASDDWLPPDKIAEQVALLMEGDWDAIYGTCWWVEEHQTQVIDLGDLETAFADGSILDHLYTDSSHAPLLQSALIRRECLLELVEERRNFKSDDWVTLIRLVERHRVRFLNRPWFYYRQHGGNTFRNYWGTLPIKVEVLSLVTPERLRARGIANMFRDQAQFLYMDRKRALAFKFLLASMILNPSVKGWAALIGNLTRRVAKRGLRRIGGPRR